MPVTGYNCSRCGKKFDNYQDCITHVARFRANSPNQDCILKFVRSHLRIANTPPDTLNKDVAREWRPVIILVKEYLRQEMPLTPSFTESIALHAKRKAGWLIPDSRPTIPASDGSEFVGTGIVSEPENAFIPTPIFTFQIIRYERTASFSDQSGFASL